MKKITALLLAILLFASATAQFTVSAVKKGDANGDGIINSDDAIFYLYSLFFPDDYKICGRTDMNGDGNVNSDDAIYLLYNLFFSDDYKLGTTTATEKKNYAPVYTNYKSEYSAMSAKLTKWFTEKLENGELFSAKVDGANVLSSAEKSITKSESGENTLIVAVYTLNSGLVFTLNATIYGKYPAVDYVITAENKGKEVSGLISDFNTLNTDFSLKKGDSYTLNTTVGSSAKSNDFEEVTNTLTSNELSFSPKNGRSSDGAWPYFDILGDNCGIVLAIGWTGKWKATFTDSGKGSVKIKAGQSDLSTVLLPGESIRTPSAVLEYFEGDAEYGHNIWRKIMVDFYSPSNRDDGYFVSPWCLNFWGGRTENKIAKVTKLFGDAGANLDAVWLDAGWYGDFDSAGDEANTANSTWHNELGWYTVNTKLFPSGLKALSDKINASGYKLMLWYMIEDGSIGYEKTLGSDSYYPTSVYTSSSKRYLKLYDDAVYEKVLKFFGNMIEKDGVDWIRIDNWLGGISAWTANDKIISKEQFGVEGKRTGYTENKHITNYYRLWDTLSEKYPEFALDNCASGGRRLDIEMAKRGVPLWRTDYNSGDNEAMQFETQNLAKWIPFSSVGVFNENTYHNLSIMAACGCLNGSGVNESNLGAYLDTLKEMITLRKYWYGSYYQIFDSTYDKTSWQAYELFREDLNAGFVAVFRRPNATENTKFVKLKGLNPKSTYMVHDMSHEDSANDSMMTGEKLMNTGIDVSGLQTSSGAVFLIKKI